MLTPKILESLEPNKRKTVQEIQKDMPYNLALDIAVLLFEMVEKGQVCTDETRQIFWINPKYEAPVAKDIREGFWQIYTKNPENPAKTVLETLDLIKEAKKKLLIEENK